MPIELVARGAESLRRVAGFGGEDEAHLSEYADRAELQHEQFTITKNGRPAVVIVSADEWESLQETLFWLSQPGIHESLAEAESDIIAGRTYNEDQVRQSLGLPTKG